MTTAALVHRASDWVDRARRGSPLAAAVVPSALLGAVAVPLFALRTGRMAVAAGGLLAGLFLLVSRARPDVLVGAVLAMSLTTLTAGFPLGVAVGGFRLALYDVLLGVAVVSLLRRPPPTRLGPFLPLALGATAVSLVVGVLHHAPIDVQVDEARSVLYLLAGVAISRSTTSERLLAQGAPLVAGILWVSTAVVAAGLLLGVPIAAVEGQAHLAVGSGSAGSSSVEFAATRYVTVTTHLAMFVLACLLGYAAAPGGAARLRAHRLLLGALFLPALVLTVISFSRNTLLGLAAALGFTLVATRSFGSTVALVAKAAASLAAVGAAGLLLFPAPTEAVAATYAGRVLAGTSSAALEIDSGVQFRAVETDLALRSIRDHPIVGIGLGSSYRPELAHDPFPPEARDYARGYVHNWYLWLATKLGLLGALPIVVLLAVALARSVVGTPSRVVLAGGLAALVTVGLVWAALRVPGTALLVGLVAGCLARPEEPVRPATEGDRPARVVTSGPAGEPGSRRTLTSRAGAPT